MTKKKWPKIPSLFYKIWHQFSGYEKLPDCSLINVYPDHNSKLGLHQDKDEQCFKAPVLSISLGCTAIFNYGKDKKKLQKTTLPSGSIVLLKDHSRLYYHSISKIITKKIPFEKKKKNAFIAFVYKWENKCHAKKIFKIAFYFFFRTHRNNNHCCS